MILLFNVGKNLKQAPATTETMEAVHEFSRFGASVYYFPKDTLNTFDKDVSIFMRPFCNVLERFIHSGYASRFFYMSLFLAPILYSLSHEKSSVVSFIMNFTTAAKQALRTIPFPVLKILLTNLWNIRFVVAGFLVLSTLLVWRANYLEKKRLESHAETNRVFEQYVRNARSVQSANRHRRASTASAAGNPTVM